MNAVAPQSPSKPVDPALAPSPRRLTHLRQLEAESIHVLREVVAEFENPVMLYSIGKDSAVLVRLAQKAFAPGKLPFPLLHIDTTWKFREMIAFRDRFCKEQGLDLLVHRNEAAIAEGINPFDHGSQKYTTVMKTHALLAALKQHRFDAAFGGARRDEEKSRAKERILSFRDAHGQWDPKSQRPELWSLYSAKIKKGESIRAFPLSNWTELDVWQYIYLESIPIVPLYLAAPRPVVERDGTLVMVDDHRMRLLPGEVPREEWVRFRTLGCYPLTGAVRSRATTLPDVIGEMLAARDSERQGRLIDHDEDGSMETKKREGYFDVNAQLQSHDEVVTYLQRHEQKEILRFVAVGSVDDGKSTLIGRLLHDTDGVYDDQLKAVRRASNMEGAEIDFSLFTDGLKAEREQGITIDVAYRYFTTEARKFIIADTPGHVQYTRNMATGASTASVAIILIDARLGVLQQSRRHAYIASLLGIPHLVVGVNKMDLRGWDPAVYEFIRRDFSAFAARLDFKDVTFIPMSALRGDNVVHKSANMPFYAGQTLLEYLETVPVAADRNLADFRYPVQLVLRPHLDYRGYAAQIASGVVRKGDPVMVLPSRKTSRVAAIDTYGGEVDEAFAPMSVTLRLADEIDVSRGDMLVHPENAPRVAQRFEAMMVWLHERPLDPAKSYLLKHTTQTVRADIERVEHAVDLETLEHVPASRLALNEIGRVSVRAHRPLFIDAYRANRSTGAFVLIDSLTNDTVAAGMIAPAASGDTSDGDAERELHAGRSQVSAAERRERLGHGAAAVVLEGLTPDALRRAAFAAERVLFDSGALAAVAADADAVTALVRAGALAIHVASPGAEGALTAPDGAPTVRPALGPGDDEAALARAVVRALADAGIIDR